MSDFKKSSFTVLGAGRSGIAAAKLLKRNGAEVFLSDGSDKDKLKFLDEEVLRKEGIEYEIGVHSDRIYESDIFIKSPGIPPENQVIQNAVKLNKKIYSEIEMAYRFCKSPVIAITGTNGKTTTTVLTGEIFKNAGNDTKVCGNVGLAFSEVLSDTDENSIVILEVSSYQLEDTEEFRPRVSVLMNITPDHIDWHGSFDNYLKAKIKITKNQTGDDLAVINYDDEILRSSLKGTPVRKAYFSIRENLIEKNDSSIETGSYTDNGKIIYFDKAKNIAEEIMETREINIRGNHNLYNSLAAVISARSFEIKKEIIRDTLKSFQGVEHRIEFVRELDGVSYYNDSKATNIDSLIVAIESFEKNIILILGGREKGNDYSAVDKLVRERVKEIFAVGEAREKIYDHFNNRIKVTMVSSFEEAVISARESGRRGDIVLLSPACKSFDMFESFEHRGKEFKRIVNLLK
ncbi:MAG TPA: UDP-N-acetylmuramoyl-L-alanine--D-glutamate ligase [Ignavibacteria bacterium]|nr:UDP-N-acetylmuramoyl-L-alanine--D-glutamate ligase [Ignavibacteria bacterium]